jgi:hypothetical protein
MYFPSLEPLFNLLTGWLLGVVAIGTLDKISTK